jgi:hypothetical protein
MGTVSVDSMIKAINGETVEESTDTGTEIVTKGKRPDLHLLPVATRRLRVRVNPHGVSPTPRSETEP